MTNEQLNRKINEVIIEITEIKQHLGIFKTRHERNNYEVEKITNAVEKIYNLPAGMVYCKTQKTPIPEARMTCIMLIDKLLDNNKYQSCDIFDMSPAALSHAYKTIADRYSLYKESRTKFDEICNELGVVVKL